MASREMVEGTPTTTGNEGQLEKVYRWVLGLPAGPQGGRTSENSGCTPTRASLVNRNSYHSQVFLAGFWVHPADGVFPLSGIAACLAVQTCLLFIFRGTPAPPTSSLLTKGGLGDCYRFTLVSLFPPLCGPFSNHWLGEWKRKIETALLRLIGERARLKKRRSERRKSKPPFNHNKASPKMKGRFLILAFLFTATVEAGWCVLPPPFAHVLSAFVFSCWFLCCRRDYVSREDGPLGT